MVLTFPSELERVRTMRCRRRVLVVGMSHGSEECVAVLGLVMNLTAETGPVGVRRTSISLFDGL